MRRLIDSIGPLERKWPPSTPFEALVRAIVYQQLATRAAQTIHGRLLALMPDGSPTPEAILARSEDELRAAGLSRQKSDYLRSLSRDTSDGSVPLGRLGRMSDEEVISALTRLRGIGPWSAHIFLMAVLERPDVLAVDDLGLRTAAQRAYGLEQRPTPGELERLGEPWRPWRTVAALYLWQSLRTPQALDARQRA